jgi:tRNA(fMet)-specific endonuclease VapC
VTSFLLDTNILSDLVRNPRGRVAEEITKVGESAVATSIIVAAELRFGAVKSGSKRLATQLDAILERLIIFPFDAPADEQYGQLRHDLQKKGQVIGANDMLIAAHALALGRTLVTDNLGEFKRVRGLSTKNWLR